MSKEFDIERIKSRVKRFIHKWIKKTNDINMNVGLLELASIIENAISWDDCNKDVLDGDYDLNQLINDVMKEFDFNTFTVLMNVYYNISFKKVFRYLETFNFHVDSSKHFGKLLNDIENRKNFGTIGKK